LTSQVQSEHRVAPTGEGSDNDAISVRIRKQLSVLRAIRRNQQYFFLANSSYCFLVFVNDVSAVPRLRSDDDDGTTGRRLTCRPAACLSRSTLVIRRSKCLAWPSTSCRA
jgi:hypothetical protein